MTCDCIPGLEACDLCASSQPTAPPMRGPQPLSTRVQPTPLVLPHAARLALSGAYQSLRRPPGVPATVPPTDLARLRELATDGAPCRACDDPLCTLARAILALPWPS